jgi:hypothetical protein
VVRLESNSGSSITGMCPAGQNLLVFKANRVFSIYDTETGANRTVSNSIGAVAGSIAPGPSGEVYFLSPQVGPCVCDGRSVRRIGDAVRPIIPETLATSGYVSGVVYENHYFLGEGALIGSAYHLLDYDIGNNSWWLHTVPASNLAVYQGSSRQELWGVSSGALGQTATSGHLYSYFRSPFVTDGNAGSGGSTPATNFTSSITLPWEDYGQPALRKRLRRIRVVGKGVFQVSVARDYSLTTTDTLTPGTFGNGATGDLTATGLLDLPINGRVSNAFSVKIAGDQSIGNQPWQINSVTTAVTARKD